MGSSPVATSEAIQPRADLELYPACSVFILQIWMSEGVHLFLSCVLSASALLTGEMWRFSHGKPPLRVYRTILAVREGLWQEAGAASLDFPGLFAPHTLVSTSPDRRYHTLSISALANKPARTKWEKADACSEDKARRELEQEWQL